MKESKVLKWLICSGWWEHYLPVIDSYLMWCPVSHYISLLVDTSTLGFFPQIAFSTGFHQPPMGPFYPLWDPSLPWPHSCLCLSLCQLCLSELTYWNPLSTYCPIFFSAHDTGGSWVTKTNRKKRTVLAVGRSPSWLWPQTHSSCVWTAMGQRSCWDPDVLGPWWVLHGNGSVQRHSRCSEKLVSLPLLCLTPTLFSDLQAEAGLSSLRTPLGSAWFGSVPTLGQYSSPTVHSSSQQLEALAWPQSFCVFGFRIYQVEEGEKEVSGGKGRRRGERWGPLWFLHLTVIDSYHKSKLSPLKGFVKLKLYDF